MVRLHARPLRCETLRLVARLNQARREGASNFLRTAASSSFCDAGVERVRVRALPLTHVAVEAMLRQTAAGCSQGQKRANFQRTDADLQPRSVGGTAPPLQDR